MHRSAFLRATAVLGALGALGVVPAPASACGGFFCQTSPMNQAGENILFSVEDDGSMTAYVQILYQGEADQFAWILPLPSVPTLSVGTNALFTQLGYATVPSFQLTSRVEGTCRPDPSCPGMYLDDAAEGPRATAGDSSADAGVSRGPMIEFEGVVGPYDAVVLSGGTAEELLAWLRERGYAIPTSSLPLIDDYVVRRHHFVAIRLSADRTTSEIQPLVMRYVEAQPCVPLQLTAIATVPDMPITAYFLADGRAVPSNYSIVDPTFDDAGLWLGTSSYASWVTAAADAVGGQAFVTDYAGAVPAVSLELPAIDDLARADASPRDVLRGLFERGYVGDAELLAIFTRDLAPPSGVEPRDFYNCLVQSWCTTYDAYTPAEWDPVALIEDVQDGVTAPRGAAAELLARHAWLTRLATTMSSAEMTLDPTFRIDTALSPVSNVHTAELVYECSGDYFQWAAPTRLTLPSGRVVRVAAGTPYAADDATYCGDLTTGDFAPWTSPIRLAETSRRRSLRPGGGGTCAATPTTGASGGVALGLGLAALTLARRRVRR